MLTVKFDDLGITEAELGKTTRAQVEVEIAAVVALATVDAPCLFADNADPVKVAAGKAILVSALARWTRRAARGFGDVTSQTAVDFSIRVDNRGSDVSSLQPSEWDRLRALCSSPAAGLPRGHFPPPLPPVRS